MLPSPIRFSLRRAPHFFDVATKHRGSGFLLWSAPRSVTVSPSQPLPSSAAIPEGVRVAVVVSKKLARGAKRSKIKRAWREQIIALWKHSPALFEPSYDVVVVPHTEHTASLEALAARFESATRPKDGTIPR